MNEIWDQLEFNSQSLFGWFNGKKKKKINSFTDKRSHRSAYFREKKKIQEVQSN